MLEYICIDHDFSYSFEKGTYDYLFHFSQKILLSAGRIVFSVNRIATANRQQTLTSSKEPGIIAPAI